jgi:uncharacterized damage-inducible protein DinB
MNSKILLLRKKIEGIYSGDPWYGDPFKSILKDIDPAAALKKEKKKAHSIAEILAHIISWREFVLTRLTGNEFKIEQEETFNWIRIDSNEKTAWKSLLGAMEETQNKILNILEKSDDKLLDMPVRERNYKMEYLIEGIIQHDIYHFGQISLLKKLI